MDKKMLAFVCIVALLVGAIVYLWVHRAPIPSAIEARHTDQGIEGVIDTTETITARIKAQDARTRTEVRVIHETVRTKVNALPADAVAGGLNSELSIFRGLEAGPGGMDD